MMVALVIVGVLVVVFTVADVIATTVATNSGAGPADRAQRVARGC